MSSHAYAMRDPVFIAMVRLGQAETRGELAQFCTQCHTPFGSRSGETNVYEDDATGLFTQTLDGLSQEAVNGVSCQVCHSITSAGTSNADFEMASDGVRRATLPGPVSAPHGTEHSALHKRSQLCSSCHQVVNPKDVAVEQTFGEWVRSGFNNPASDCQDCHMTEYDGKAATSGPERTVHRHTMEGVDVSLLAPDAFPGYEELRDKTRTLLAGAADLSAAFEPDARAIVVTIKNLAGHSLPSGATVDRELWVEVIVTDANGEAVFESGTLDERGDLRVDEPKFTSRPGTDPYLALFNQELYFDPALDDPTSTEPERRVEFLWEPNKEVSKMIRAGATVRPAYALPTLETGTYDASVRLLFRSFSSHVLRKLEAEMDLDPDVRRRLPTVEMQSLHLSFQIDPP